METEGCQIKSYFNANFLHFPFVFAGWVIWEEKQESREEGKDLTKVHIITNDSYVFLRPFLFPSSVTSHFSSNLPICKNILPGQFFFTVKANEAKIRQSRPCLHRVIDQNSNSRQCDVDTSPQQLRGKSNYPSL